MDSPNDALVIGMAKAVHYHLSYINTVARTEVLAESCFRLPAVEYIERHPNLGVSVFLEYPHLVYKYRRIDLSWAKKGADVPNAFLEMKFVKGETANKTEQQRFYNDLARQTAILLTKKDVKCYFIASGLSLDWDNCFVYNYVPIENTETVATTTTRNGKKKANKQKVKSVYNDWFSFDMKNPGKIFSINANTACHNTFKGDYVQKADIPEITFRRIRTRLLWLSSLDNTPSLNSGTLTGIWEIRR